jgi:hypothetical protein
MMRKTAVSISGVLMSLALTACGAPDPADLESLGESSSALCQAEQAFQGAFPWPTAVVPYTFDEPWVGGCGPSGAPVNCVPLANSCSGTGCKTERDIVRAAMTNWTNATGGAVTFRPKTSADSSYVRIDKQPGAVIVNPGNGSANPAHLNLGGISVMAAAHELGHVLGMYHHQQRNDRDKYLTMNLSGIGNGVDANGNPITCASPGDATYNETFTKVPAAETYGVFDFSSVMLYTGHTSTMTGYTKKDGTLVFGWESGTGQPSYKDGSAVLEHMNKANGWRKLEGADVSKNGDLNFNRSFGPSSIYATGTPGVCYRKDATPVLVRFTTGTDLRLWLKEGSASNWTRLGTTLSFTNPACASWGSGRVDVVVTGTDNVVYKIGYHDGAWETGPSSIGAPPGAPSAPAIAAWDVNRLDVFVLSGGSLYIKSWNGSSWTGWSIPKTNPAGVTFTGNPGAASEASGKLAIAARATDGKLYLLEFASSTWSNWTEIGSASSSGVGSPGIASWGAGRLDVVVQGPTNQFIWQKARVNGSWVGWFPMGGVLDQPPAIAAATGNKIDLVALNRDSTPLGSIWEKAWRPL